LALEGWTTGQIAKGGSKVNDPDCYQCIHRGNVPGDAHSCCRYPGNKTDLFDLFSPENFGNFCLLGIEGHPNGVQNGWFAWPVNFDPVWLLNCDGFQARKAAREWMTRSKSRLG